VTIPCEQLNFKWKGGGDEVKWHQDIQFWPHSTFTPLTLGLYLNDVTDEMGPLGVVPLSSYNKISPLEDEASGAWTGVLPESVVETLPLEKAQYLQGTGTN
jgi:ectoine hydroxylase